MTYRTVNIEDVIIDVQTVREKLAVIDTIMTRVDTCMRVEAKHPVLVLVEEERQLVIKALASLSRINPGLDAVLNSIAIKIDNVHEGRAVMYEAFRNMLQNTSNTIDAEDGCKLCGKTLAYPGARFCGGACSQAWECGKRPAT